MKRKDFTQEQLNEIYTLYFEKNYSLRDLVEIFGGSQSVYDRIFKENGWPKHDKTYKARKYSIDEHCFDEIDTPDKAYALGLLYADGCNHYEDGKISIELQARDADVLKDLNILFGSNKPLLFTSAENSKNRKQDTYRLDINSRYLSNRINDLGMIPRKSLTLDFPNWMDNELIPFMLKGYIDGDGWIQKYVIGFMSTDKFCYATQKYLLEEHGIESHILDMKRHYNEHTKELYINGRKNLIPFTEMMFAQPTMGIPRKIQSYYDYGFLTR